MAFRDCAFCQKLRQGLMSRDVLGTWEVFIGLFRILMPGAYIILFGTPFLMLGHQILQ